MEVRIYYEDTDAGGVVYHSNYISYMERARTEFLRTHGLSVREMHDMGIIFPVVHIDANFRAPARLDDLLEVRTQIAVLKNSSFTVAQQVVRKEDGKLLVEAKVTLACVSPEMKAKRLPNEIRELFTRLLEEDGGKEKGPAPSGACPSSGTLLSAQSASSSTKEH